MDPLTDFRPPSHPTLCLKTYPSCVFSSTSDYFSLIVTRPAESSPEIENYYWDRHDIIPEETESEQEPVPVQTPLLKENDCDKNDDTAKISAQEIVGHNNLSVKIARREDSSTFL